MSRRHKCIILILLCSLLLTGCWDQKVFEQVSLTLSFGIEESANNNIITTHVFPVIGAVEKGAVDILSTESHNVRGGRTNLRLMSPKLMEGGKIQQILISDGLAKKGIHDLLEIFQRDVTLPSVSFVAIVEGSPNELLKKAAEIKTKPRVSYYLYFLLENNVKLSNTPNTKVFDFDINYFAPGLDPIAPMIKLENNLIKITGCALFDDDKMTGKLENNETTLLLGMMNHLKHSDFIIDDPGLRSEVSDKHGVAITLLKPKRKIEISFNDEGNPIIDINLMYPCNIDEYKWDDTMDPTMQKILEKQIAEHLTKISSEVIRKLQEANCDPIGIGDMIRAKYNAYFKSIDWKEVYQEADIKVSIEVEVRNVGIVK